MKISVVTAVFNNRGTIAEAIDSVLAQTHPEVELIVIDGKPWQRDASYRITVNSYLAAGGDRFRLFVDGREAVGGPLDVDALAEYLQRRSAQRPLAVDPQPRITRREAQGTAAPVR